MENLITIILDRVTGGIKTTIGGAILTAFAAYIAYHDISQYEYHVPLGLVGLFLFVMKDPKGKTKSKD